MFDFLKGWGSSVNVHNPLEEERTAIPSVETLEKASAFEVVDEEGNKVKFGALIEKKVLVVFIRHFFCSACLSYSQNLAHVPQEALDAAGIQIVLIGCGEHICIKDYHEASGFKGPIYADPTRTLFRALGMTYDTIATAPEQEARASYLGTKTNQELRSSSWLRAWLNPGLIGQQGNIFQNGGEFILGPGNQCTLASRMAHTMHHIPVEEMMKSAGVEYKETA
ncbi:AhpC/TSA antioxidant enzyme-domain-containing protein [Coprinopsis sp. MPI-PUGE-AT-0042]|nr:AhpC/TSA antioxidant enzyme-domain-containing protein [Coprinopsis sp. MPI-PUGE-AT-0042]